MRSDFNTWSTNLKKNEIAFNSFKSIGADITDLIDNGIFEDKTFSNDNIFDAFIMVLNRKNCRYDPFADKNQLLLENRLSCFAATDLFLGVILYFSIGAREFEYVHLTMPILAPPFPWNAPVKIRSNITQGGGGGRVLFRNHDILALDLIQYDVLSGTRAVNLPLIQGTLNSADPIICQFDVNNQNYIFTFTGDNGTLAEYTVNPNLD